MLAIFCATIILLLLFMSAGYALFALLRYAPRNPFLAFFAGLFVVSLLGMTISLFMPLNMSASLLCFTPALFGVVPLVAHLRSLCKSWRICAWALLSLCVIAGLCSFSAAWAQWPSIAYDTDLYHVQIIRWLNEYGTPLGLGNLHSRFANTSAWLIIAALLNHGPLHGSVAWYMMPLFLTGFASYCSYEVAYENAPYARAYALCLLPVFIYANMLLGYPNLYHDFPSLALVGIVGGELLHFLYDAENDEIKNAILICICVTLAFLMKPLPVVTVLCVPLFLLYILRIRGVLAWRVFFLLFTLPICAACIFCVRSIITSGYPLFPVPIFPLDIDWLMDKEVVAGNALDVRAWARMPGPLYREAFEKGITFWFMPWLHSQISRQTMFTTFLPFFLGSVLWLVVCKRLTQFVVLFLFAWPVASILYWFWLAPDLRFGNEYFWLFCAMGGALCVHYRPQIWQSLCAMTRCSERTLLSCVVCLFLLLTMTGGLLRYVKSRPLQEVAWVTPGVIVARPTETRIVQHPDREQFVVYVTTNGDDRCGDAPLPCTPYFNTRLEMRKDGDLGAGFRMRP